MSEIEIKVEDLTEKQAKEFLSRLLDALEELDGEDFFGTEGWRHFLGFGD